MLKWLKWEGGTLRLKGGFSNPDALAGSIDKWEWIVARLNLYPDSRVVDGGRLTCQLCDVHFAKSCRGCVIFRDTGKEGCKGTPYEEFARKPPDIQRVVAEAELKYLKSLYLKCVQVPLEDKWADRLKYLYGHNSLYPDKEKLYLYFLNYVEPHLAYQMVTAVGSRVGEVLEGLTE